MAGMRELVLVRGAGDVATAVAIRLRERGLGVVCTELPQPLAIRRAVVFAEAVYEGRWAVEGHEAVRVASPDEALKLSELGAIPVLAPEGDAVTRLRPEAIVDARMAKRNLGTHIREAPIVIGLGPGFTAGVDCHAAVETLRGPNLGKVYLRGSPLPVTHRPCPIGGISRERVLRAPRAGHFFGYKAIGERVRKGEAVAWCSGEELRALCDGVIRGILRSGIEVPAGTKVVEIDPRGDPQVCFRVAERSWRIAAGVLEALDILGL
ncbi:MAG: EF2563 family selenium-dependent molybdenum hydroxylase system protein [Caldiserica bacterium]|nr:EF2563 family selenium-dependent molybdenum hydroxylase system protein [Caldisericota bacterium]